MRKGDRVKDRLTGSIWTIDRIWTTDPARRSKWIKLVSDAGATRRIMDGELEARYDRTQE